MAVNNTLSVKEYALTGAGARVFPITFEFTTNDSGNAENIHCVIAEKNDDGEYINSREIAEGLNPEDFQVEGGNVKFIDDVQYAGLYFIIFRITPPTQLVDFIDNGSYSLEDIERAIDKLTFLIQERTGTPAGTNINIGVSLFFASILQLTNKKDFLDALFNSWSDIAEADRPGVAAEIRGQIDAASRIGDNDFQGHNSFTYSPTTIDNISDLGSTAFSTKGYVDSKCATERSHTDGFFPVATGNLKQTSGSEAVTTATMRDGAVTTAKIADANVTWAKLRKGSETVTLTWDYQIGAYTGTWTGSGKIPYSHTGTNNGNLQVTSSGFRLSLANTSNKATVYFFY